MENQEANPPIGQMIDKKTTLFGFLANMATSSKIPRSYSKFFIANDKNGSMVGLNIREDDLAFTLNGMKQSQLRGALVDASYAKMAYDSMDHVTKEAEIAGFVDAFVIKEGKLIGHVASANAAVGFMVPKQKKRVAILGAGSMCRALCLNLDDKGFDEVVIMADKVEDAMQVIEDVSPYASKLSFDIDRVEPNATVNLENVDYFINATTAGLFSHDKIIEVSDANDVTFIDFALNAKQTLSLFESFAKENGCDYIDATKLYEASALNHFSVWFEEQPKNTTISIQRG